MPIPKRVQADLNVWSGLLAAQWAQHIGAKPGNYWEPQIARHLRNEVLKISPDDDADLNVRAFVEARFRHQIGL